MTDGLPRRVTHRRPGDKGPAEWSLKAQRLVPILMGFLVGMLLSLSAMYLYVAYKNSALHVDAWGRRIPPGWANGVEV